MTAYKLTIALLLLAATLNAQTSKTPINNGILQSDLNAAGYKILSANLADYAGSGLSWNVATNKFDSAGGGGLPIGGTTGQALTKNSSTNYDVGWSTISGGGGGVINAPAPLTLNSTGKYNDPVGFPFTAANSGIFIKDATGREILRLWSGNSDTSVVGHNNFNLYLGYEAGFTQPSDNTTAGTQNVGIGPWALRYITTGQGNTAVGANALRYNQAGLANVAVGASAMQSSHTLEGSTAVGVNALKDADDGGQGGDTAIGFAALYQQGPAGGDNTSVGRYSGLGVLKDNGMVFLGSGARRIGDSNIPMINAISIGYQAEVATSYTTVIGNSQHTDIYFGSTAGNSILHGKGAYPSGGTTGQVLKKNSNTDFDVNWGAGGGSGTVTDFSAGDLSPLFTTTEATTTTTPALSFGLTNAAATTVFGRAAGTSGAPTYSSAPQFLKIGNLTTNGFVKTGSSDGTLTVDTATYQPSDADLTTWAGITPGTNVGTFLATPSSANLRAAVTDENGTGAALFSGATTPDFTTGFTIGAAAASGKIPIGNGTNYVPSTPSWPTAAGTAGYQIRSDGTNFASYPSQITNSSTANLTPSTSDIYLTGSSVVVAAGDFKQKGQYRCVFDMAKTAGTGGIVITLRIGTAGTTSDAAIQTYTFGSGTSVADTGVFDVVVNWRSVGSGTSAVVQGICRGLHNLATTGLFNNAAGWLVIGSPSPSSGFNSSTATTIGLSFNGGTAFSGTNTLVQAQLQQ